LVLTGGIEIRTVVVGRAHTAKEINMMTRQLRRIGSQIHRRCTAGNSGVPELRATGRCPAPTAAGVEAGGGEPWAAGLAGCRGFQV
jgi:hypothetical protein